MRAKAKNIWGIPNLSSLKKFRNDLFLIAVILIFSVVLFAIFFMTGEKGGAVEVIKNGENIGSYSLAKNIELDISTGKEQINHLVIKNGKAWIDYANCPDLICKNHREISKTGETIVCLPHKLVIRVVSLKEDEADVIA